MYAGRWKVIGVVKVWLIDDGRAATGMVPLLERGTGSVGDDHDAIRLRGMSGVPRRCSPGEARDCEGGQASWKL